MDSSTNVKGKLAETMLLAEFVRRGIRVSLPYQADSPYDMVVEMGGLIRVQVKWGRVEDGCVLFACASQQRANTSAGFRRAAYQDVDMFGVYCGELEECYLVGADAVSNTIMRLRLQPSRQTARVHYADEYRLSSVLDARAA
jgi:hypothetical protein